MNNLIKDARHIPVDDARTTISVSPVTLEAPERAGRSGVAVLSGTGAAAGNAHHWADDG